MYKRQAKPQPSVSRKQSLAVSRAKGDVIGLSWTYFAMSLKTLSGLGLLLVCKYAVLREESFLLGKYTLILLFLRFLFRNIMFVYDHLNAVMSYRISYEDVL